jgi:hypothetical protein
MNKQELKTKLKNPDFKSGYNVSEGIWRERMSFAVQKEKNRGDELLDLSVHLLNENIGLKARLQKWSDELQD